MGGPPDIWLAPIWGWGWSWGWGGGGGGGGGPWLICGPLLGIEGPWLAGADILGAIAGLTAGFWPGFGWPIICLGPYEQKLNTVAYG